MTCITTAAPDPDDVPPDASQSTPHDAPHQQPPFNRRLTRHPNARMGHDIAQHTAAAPLRSGDPIALVGGKVVPLVPRGEIERRLRVEAMRLLRGHPTDGVQP